MYLVRIDRPNQPKKFRRAKARRRPNVFAAKPSYHKETAITEKNVVVCNRPIL